MHEIQRFALQHIYCSPAQDQQYRFGLVRVTKKGYPVKKTVSVYNDVRPLPNTTSKFHVYVLGSIPLEILNLLRKERNWLKNIWYNAAEDMNLRNFILQIYDEQGLNFPRSKIYYSSGWDGSLVIALEVDPETKRTFEVENFRYLRLYSNQYFDTSEFNDGSGKKGIHCQTFSVANNIDKVAVQNVISSLEANGGKTMVYVNGYFTSSMTLHIPNNSIVEIVYDNSIVDIEKYHISDLRTFESVKDNKLKYILFRPRQTEYIQYEDDLEVYITGDVGFTDQGLYYYQHKAYSLTNVTDKDFALYTSYVLNQAQTLSNLLGGGVMDKTITVMSRKSGIERNLIYSSLKLHELYRLPDGVEFDVISNTGYTLSEMRVEQLENSDYFKVASAPTINTITKELATSAVGYNGISYYMGKTPSKLTGVNVDVPFLYRKNSIAYEYDNSGKLLGYYPSTGPAYIASEDAKYVEFVQGQITTEPGLLYRVNEPIPLKDSEFRVLAAHYNDYTRITTWEDITEDASCVYENNTVTVNDVDTKRVRIMYLDEAYVKDYDIAVTDGVIVFPITVYEDRGTGPQNHLLDLPYASLEVFLNGNRLTYKVDFFIDFPYIGICNKKYIKYSEPEQKIHIRLSGYNLDKSKINQNEIRGFVSHGVLTRNNYYDIREDKVFSTFIDGKLVDNASIMFSEEDNTVRTANPLNGLPYTMTEHFLSITEATGTSTLPYYEKNKEINAKISELYNAVYPEPPIDNFIVIPTKHNLYSIIVSKVIHDLVDGNIAQSLYTTPYNDTTILDLLNTRYKRELLLDPIKADLPKGIVEIHPHFGNDVVSVNLFQFRFLTNLVRILTQGKPELINLSGYVAINNETVDLPTSPSGPGGIVVV